MDLRENTFQSATNFIERMILLEGYSLKKYSLKKWIYGNGFTQQYVARKMDIDPDDFKRKLREREKFNKPQIWALIKLMGAEDAFKVLYFPTKQQRRQVWWQVFGKYKEKRNE